MTPYDSASLATQQLPEPTLRRLPWYLALLSSLRKRNVEYVSSTRIADELQVDASQIAKDLSFLNIKGKTRIGYEVVQLEKVLREFLGFDIRHNAVILGAGSLGGALMRDSGLQRYGLNIVAGFDINSEIVGTHIGDIEVLPLERLAETVRSLNVAVGIITVPNEAAQSISDLCVASGITAIWNFTPVRIRVRPGIVIQNTSIYSNLAVIYNRMQSI